MDIPLKAQVHCADGPCGRSTYVIINPLTQRVTHLVVKPNKAPRIERLVAARWVVRTTPNVIWLRCMSDKLARMEPFIEIKNIQVDLHDYAPLPDEDLLEGYLAYPYFPSVEHRRIPPGESAVHRSTWVKATGRHVGRVERFLINPADGRITHLVLRKGLLWSQKSVSIPVSQIDRIGEDAVYLKLDKPGVEALPALPVRRR